MVAVSQGTKNNLEGLGNANTLLGFAQKLGFKGAVKKSFPNMGFYGGDAQIAVFLEPCSIFPKGLGIDLMSQDASGTGANKIPYKIISIQTGWQFPGVLVVEGSGRGLQRPSNWARSLVGKQWLRDDSIFGKVNHDNLLGSFTLSEFRTWLEMVKQNGTPVTSPVIHYAEEVVAVQQSLF